MMSRRSTFPAGSVPWGVGLLVAVLLSAWPARGAAQVSEAQIKGAVQKAAGYLRLHLTEGSDGGSNSLGAYGLIKAGEPPTSPLIQRTVAQVVKRATGGKYQASNYQAGVELMLLEAADPEKNREAMEGIVQFLIKNQHPTGAWDYSAGDGFDGGDTSQCQYAMLGFWAAERSGIKVPPYVWDKGAQWFVETQLQTGAFAYHPRSRESEPRATMTVAGVGSLYLCRLHLYPNDKDPGEKPPKKNAPKFGVLEEIDLDVVEQPDGTKIKKDTDYTPGVKAGTMLASANRGAGWLSQNFSLTGGSVFHMYYLYTLERMAALANVQFIGGHDWYREGAAHLLKAQATDGSWSDQCGPVPATAFGILFLTKATAKQLGRAEPLEPLGTGLLAGGRGLPDNLNQAAVSDGKVETQKDLGPIDQLLAELEKIEDVNVNSTQEAIIETIQLGDREALIQQKDRLVKLAKHPHAEVRRTAIWALGRTGDLGLAKLLYEALDDNHVDVMVEAHNALCVLSRIPLGFGLPQTPFGGLPENAGADQRQAAVDSWRKQLKEKWGAWYYKYRPYRDRDDLSEALFEAQ